MRRFSRMVAVKNLNSVEKELKNIKENYRSLIVSL